MKDQNDKLYQIAREIDDLVNDRVSEIIEGDDYKYKYERLIEILKAAKENLESQIKECSLETSPVRMIQLESSKDAVDEILDRVDY